MAIATIGLTDSNAGALGTAYNTISDAILDGLLNSITFGPRAELEEMQDLYNALVELRDQ